MNSVAAGLPSSNPDQETTNNYTAPPSNATKKWRHIKDAPSADELWQMELAGGFVRLLAFRERATWSARAEGRQIVVHERELNSLKEAQREAERLAKQMLARLNRDLP